MKIEYDPEVDIFYVRFVDNPVAESLESKSGAIVDLDEAGNVVGLEVLDFRKKTASTFAYAIPSADNPERLRELVLAS